MNGSIRFKMEYGTSRAGSSVFCADRSGSRLFEGASTCVSGKDKVNGVVSGFGNLSTEPGLFCKQIPVEFNQFSIHPGAPHIAGYQPALRVK